MKKDEKAIVADRSRSDWERAIYEWVHNEDDRRMLIRYLLDGRTIAQIAEEFSLSPVQTQSRIARAKKQLFKRV